MANPPSNYLEWFGALWNATTGLIAPTIFELMPREQLRKKRWA